MNSLHSWSLISSSWCRSPHTFEHMLVLRTNHSALYAHEWSRSRERHYRKLKYKSLFRGEEVHVDKPTRHKAFSFFIMPEFWRNKLSNTLLEWAFEIRRHHVPRRSLASEHLFAVAAPLRVDDSRGFFSPRGRASSGSINLWPACMVAQSDNTHPKKSSRDRKLSLSDCLCYCRQTRRCALFY